MRRPRTPGRREEQKRQRRLRICRSALDLFREKGFEKTTVEEIARHAGVAKGTFFNYFETKEDVLLYLGEQQIGGLHALTWAAEAPQSSPLDRIQHLLLSLARRAEEDRELVRLVVNHALRVADLAQDARFGFRALVSLLIAQAQRAGQIRSDISPEIIAGWLEGSYFYELFQWSAARTTYSLVDRMRITFDAWLAGMAAPDRRDGREFH
ncbi:MAG: TetR family transcriptional regulator FadR [Anaerolineae bacterium]